MPTLINSYSLSSVIGIGTDTPNKNLTVVGDISSTGRLYDVGNTNSSNWTTAYNNAIYTINGTANQISVSNAGNNTGNNSVTISLPNSVNITTLNILSTLNVTGSANFFNTTYFAVSDNIIYFGEGNNANLLDLGIASHFIGNLNNGSSKYQHTGFIRRNSQNSPGIWTLFSGLTSEPESIPNGINWSDPYLQSDSLSAYNVYVNNGNSIQWNSNYTSFNAQSANNASVYTTVQQNSSNQLLNTTNDVQFNSVSIKNGTILLSADGSASFANGLTHIYTDGTFGDTNATISVGSIASPKGIQGLLINDHQYDLCDFGLQTNTGKTYSVRLEGRNGNTHGDNTSELQFSQLTSPGTAVPRLLIGDQTISFGGNGENIQFSGGTASIDGSGNASLNSLTLPDVSQPLVCKGGAAFGYNGGPSPNFTIDESGNISQPTAGTSSFANGAVYIDASGNFTANVITQNNSNGQIIIDGEGRVGWWKNGIRNAAFSYDYGNARMNLFDELSNASIYLDSGNGNVGIGNYSYNQVIVDLSGNITVPASASFASGNAGFDALGNLFANNFSTSNYSTFNTQSANNISVYSTFNAQSANNTNVYSKFSTQSANNLSVYSTFNGQSANNTNVYSNFSTQSANNTSVFSTVQGMSANDKSVYSTFNAQSANNTNVYSNFSTQSANNLSVYSTFNGQSANNTNVYSNFSTQSANNLSVYSTFNGQSANNTNVYTNFSTQSANNLSVYSTFNGQSANNTNVYSNFSTQSANNLSVYSTFNGQSANNTNVYSNFSTQSANNLSVYSTFNQNSSNLTTTSNVTANIAAGNIGIGTVVLSGTTLQQFVNQLLTTIYYPTSGAPSTSLSLASPFNTSTVESGTSATSIQFTANFTSSNQGYVNGKLVNGFWQSGTQQGTLVGNASAFSFMGVNVGSTNPYTSTANVIIADGTNTFTTTVYYNSGSQYYNSANQPWNQPYPAGSINASTTVTGARKAFYGTNITNASSISASDVRALASSVLNPTNATNFNINVVAGTTTNVAFAYPTSYISNTPQAINSGTGYNDINAFNKTTISVGGTNNYNPVSTTVYVLTGVFTTNYTYTITL